MPSAERVNWAKFRVIVVSAVALLILFTLFYLLTGDAIFESKAVIYLYIPDATGLSPGSPVRVDGLGVGKVDKIELTGSTEPNRIVRLTLLVDEKRLPSITLDSKTELSYDSFIGDRFVDISSGTSPDHVRAGGELRLKAPNEVMKSVDITQFAQQLRNVDALLADIQQGKNQFGQFLLGTSVYDDTLRKVAQLDQALRTATQTTSQIGGYLYGDAVYRQLSQPIADLDDALASIQREPMLRDNAGYEQLRGQLADIRNTIEVVGSAEWMQSTSAYDSWTRNINSLIQTVEGFNESALLNSTDFYEQLNGASEEAAKGVREFRRDPRKFLRLKF
jgi:phospholipid/cholesterol/gamma-HCH transport system substrate-binding protein